MSQHYYAVRPKTYTLEYTRIEKANDPKHAVRLAYGGPILNYGNYIYADLGTRLSIIQSDKKRKALLVAEENWHPVA